MAKYIIQLRALDNNPAHQVQLQVSHKFRQPGSYLQIVNFRNPDIWAPRIEIVSVNYRLIPPEYRVESSLGSSLGKYLPTFRIREDITVEDFGIEWV
jgi:hypothetical protein